MRALRVIASSISPSISHETFFSTKRRAAKRRFACNGGDLFIYRTLRSRRASRATRRRRRVARNSKAFEKIANASVRAATGENVRLYVAGSLGVVDATAEDLSGSKATAKVPCTLAISSTLGRAHAWHRGIIHAPGNLKKFETATEILDTALGKAFEMISLLVYIYMYKGGPTLI